MSKTTYHTPEKIVIVAGPSFGQALKFMLLGAAAGYAAANYLKPKVAPQPARGAKGALQDAAGRFLASKFDPHKASAKAEFKAEAKTEFSKAAAAVDDINLENLGAEATEQVADRLESLSSRLKSIGSRAKQLVETASEAVKPTLETALAEGKRVAAEVQTNLKKDVVEAGDTPAIAKEDGELPSEKEDKLVE